MNPNENNPNSPMGAGGVAPGAGAPLDFTNPSTLENSGLGGAPAGDVQSMSTPDTASTNIDGTMNGNISPTTMPPLTPAEPVPGSIGSVTSVPPLAPEPMDVGALGGNATAGATSSNMPVMGQAPDSKPAAGSNESPYYNPFLRNSVNTTAGENTTSAPAAATTSPAPMASNAPVPPVMQPKAEDKFAERLKKNAGAKKPSNVMTLLGWLLAVLFAVVAIVMGILWWGEKNKKPQVIYVPANDQDENQDPDGGNDNGDDENPGVVGNVAVLKCTMESGVEGEEMPGLISGVSDMVTNYGENGLADMSLNVGYVFTDADAAAASKPTVDLVDAALAGVMAAPETGYFTHGVSQVDNVVNFSVSADAATIVNDAALADMLRIPTTEDGTRNTNVDAVREVYEAEGFVCTTE